MHTADASVIIKWLFPEEPEENDSTQTIQLLKDYQYGKFEIFQPVHYIAEVAAVATRVSPETANKKIELLHNMNLKIKDELIIYQLASKLSEQYNHHLFDTLYHAVALASGLTTLITADEKYYRKAKKTGYIKLLRNYQY